jgi:hypothetical protein
MVDDGWLMVDVSENWLENMEKPDEEKTDEEASPG